MTDTFCTIYLVRHGETDYNRMHKVQGHLQIPLNDFGREQARVARKRFTDIPFDKVYTSDLIRAKETGEILAQEQRLEVELREELRERYLSCWQGKSQDELPDDLRKAIAVFNTLTPDEQWERSIVPGSETNAQIVGRAFTFIRAVALEHLGKNILMVTHGGVLRVLLIHLGVLHKKDAYDYAVDNLGYVQLQSEGATFIVKEIKGLKKKE